MSIVRISVPEVDVNQTRKFTREDTVWTFKLQVVNKLKNLPEAFNFGFYIQGSSANDTGFLEDHRLLFDYQLPNNSMLILKRRARELNGIPEKQAQKWNNKKQQKVFMEWVQKKAVTKIKEALEKGFDPNFVSDNGDTPLCYAASIDANEVILLLVQNGGAFLDLRGNDYKTAVHRAVLGGHVRSLSTLLGVGGSPNVVDKDGMTPLYIAAMQGKPGCAEALLVAGAKLNTLDDNGRNELHQACLKDSPQCVQLLVDFGANVNAKNQPGNTPLHVAASVGSTGCAKILLSGGADKSVQNAAGDTAHQVAILTEHWEVADLIGNFKEDQVKPVTLRQPNAPVDLPRTPNSAPLFKLREYIPPPPPVGYKGICAPPADAPLR